MGAEEPGPSELTREERRLRLALRVFAGLSALFSAGYLIGGIFDGEEFRFVANSVTKDALFFAIAIVAAANLRRFGWLVLLVIAGHAVLIAAQLVMLAVGGQPAVKLFGAEIDPVTFTLVWIGLDVLVIAVFTLLYRSAQRARYRLAFFSPTEFVTLRALAEVLIQGERESLGPDEVARNVDSYLAEAEARGKGRIKAAFLGLAVFPMLTLRPPFAAMPPAERLRFVKKRFLYDVSERRTLAPLRPYVQAMIRTASQFTYLGYYGDERSFDSVGYVPFSKREGYAAAVARVDQERRGVEPLPSERVTNGGSPHDAIVIGSGAAGAIVAYRLAQRGRRVLVLERGKHVQPSEFTEDEVEMYLKLYNEGALQLSRDFRFQVLQGMCVGGSTVVNNGVCFPTPERVLRHWNDERGAGLDEDDLQASFDEVGRWLHVDRPSPRVFTAGTRKFEQGVRELGLEGSFDVVKANIADCLGCGYCNLGCAFGMKLSMLDSVLPWAQRDFGDRVQILPQARVIGIETDRGRARAVHAEVEGEPRRLEAETIVVSAGAVNSSWILERSGIGGGRVGRELYFNMGSPITAEFAEKMDSYAGLQMSHYYDPGDDEGFVLESWFNPVATQALVMPGWFEDHFRNMSRYDHMVAGGVLVGTRGPARLRAKRSGPDIKYTPAREDLARLVSGLKLLGRIFLKAKAEKVMPSTYRFHELRSEGDLEALDSYVRDSSDIQLNTSHPQGGNPIGTNGHSVVDPSFRVHGFRNLYVCDASVFPSSVTVNPQFTVMALAHYAGDRIE